MEMLADEVDYAPYLVEGWRDHKPFDYLLPEHRVSFLGRVCGARYATAPKPFFATSVSNFNDAPRGRFTPRSHWLTKPVVTLR